MVVLNQTPCSMRSCRVECSKIASCRVMTNQSVGDREALDAIGHLNSSCFCSREETRVLFLLAMSLFRLAVRTISAACAIGSICLGWRG
jgi:hypothetical protein